MAKNYDVIAEQANSIATATAKGSVKAEAVGGTLKDILDYAKNGITSTAGGMSTTELSLAVTTSGIRKINDDKIDYNIPKGVPLKIKVVSGTETYTPRTLQFGLFVDGTTRNVYGNISVDNELTLIPTENCTKLEVYLKGTDVVEIGNVEVSLSYSIDSKFNALEEEIKSIWKNDDYLKVDVQPSINLFTEEGILEGKLINDAGTPVAYTNAFTTDFIATNGIDSIYYEGQTKTNIRKMFTYDANKLPIANSAVNYADYCKIPVGAKFIRLSFMTSVPREKIVVRPMYTDRYTTSTCTAYLPKDIYVAVGRTIELYNNQICLEADKFHIQWYCRNAAYQFIGKAMKRKFVLSPTNIGEYTLTCKIYDDKLSVIWFAECNVHVVAENVSSMTICPIGDSLTNNKAWMSEVINLSGGSISYVGTFALASPDAGGVQRTGGHEGRSGFKAEDYIIGTPYTFGGASESPHNKFWDGTRFNWNYYKTHNAISCDAVQIFLGTNAIKGLDVKKEAEREAEYLKQMVDYILLDEPNKPIYLVYPPFFGNQNGMGNQSGVDGFSTDATRWKYNMYRGVMYLVKKVDELLSSYSSVHIVPIAFTHDSEYNYGSVETPVNPRAIQKEYLPSEAAHPQPQGYYQMADAMFSVYCGTI